MSSDLLTEIDATDEHLQAVIEDFKRVYAEKIRRHALIPFCRRHELTYRAHLYGEDFIDGEVEKVDEVVLRDLEGYQDVKRLLRCELLGQPLFASRNADITRVTKEDLLYE